MRPQSTSEKHLATNDNVFDEEIVSSGSFYIHTASGKKFLDFTSGWCVGNLGWGQKEISAALRKFSGPAYVSPAFSYAPWNELATALSEIAPGRLDVCYRTTGGSESVDLALQIAMAYTGRKKFMCIDGGYHGNTIGALSVGGSTNKEDLPALLPGCIRIKGELNKKRLDHISTLLSAKDVAAFILEPVIMNKGVEIPEPEFMKGLQRLCRKYATLLIADEVACGFGRTGRFFATEHFDLKPDLLTLGKALSGGYAGIGATLTTPAIHKAVKNKISAYSTYGWHPLGVSAALAALRFYTENRQRLLDNVMERSQQLRTALSQVSFKKGGRLSIIGLAIAVDLEEKKYAESVMDKCRKNGLLITAQDNKITLFPPLTITRQATDQGIRIIRQSV